MDWGIKFWVTVGRREKKRTMPTRMIEKCAQALDKRRTRTRSEPESFDGASCFA